MPLSKKRVRPYPFSTTRKMMTIKIQYQDQFGHWRNYGTYHHAASTYHLARQLASRTGKRHRLISDNGALLDLTNP